jgi:hypothetical protein
MPRHIIFSAPSPTSKFPSACIVRFNETSVVGVNDTRIDGPERDRLVRRAALTYSKNHPDGVIESVMVNLSGDVEK